MHIGKKQVVGKTHRKAGIYPDWKGDVKRGCEAPRW
jgi:hypothetical protein